MAQNPVIAKVCADFSPFKGDQTPDIPADSAKDPKSRNKDLQKTKLCVYHVQGKCGLGTSCQFAHSASEIRKAPNLAKTGLCKNFMNGNCELKNCTYAHGEAELVNPPSFKKKMCVWFKQGKCRNGSNCGFVHDSSEWLGDSALPEENEMKPWKSAGRTLDCDASTAVPPSGSSQTGSTRSQMETDVTKPIPDEHLFRMMAGRGSAPLQQQVKSMGLAIGELQEKLIQMQGRQQASSNAIEGAGLQKQVDEMQQVINQLSKQYQEMEVGMQLSSLRTKQQPPPAMLRPSTKVLPGTATSRSAGQWWGPSGSDGPNNNEWQPNNADWAGGPIVAAPTVRAEDRTVMRRIRKQGGNSGLSPLPEKAQPAQSSYKKHSLPFEMRAALGVAVVAIMIMVEVVLR